MASTSEIGHAKNVANFGTLITYVISFGADYKPSRTALKLINLQSVAASSGTALIDVNTAQAEDIKAASAFQLIYKPFDKLITRAINSLKSTDAPDGTITAAASIVRELRGKRAKPRKTEEEKAALAAEGETVVEISASQVSIDNRINNFDRLIKLLEATPQYAPNETDLTTESLNTYHDDLKSKNDAAKTARVNLVKARENRDKIFYAPASGLVDLGIDTKAYIKSAFDAAVYSKIAKITFTKIKA